MRTFRIDRLLLLIGIIGLTALVLYGSYWVGYLTLHLLNWAANMAMGFLIMLLGLTLVGVLAVFFSILIQGLVRWLFPKKEQ